MVGVGDVGGGLGMLVGAEYISTRQGCWDVK